MEKKSGSIWSLGAKSTQALAVGISLPLLGLLGFDPRTENGPDEIAALRYVFALMPALFYLAAIITIRRFPITQQRLDRLREAFDRRVARSTIVEETS